jgi:hypothetical protein
LFGCVKVDAAGKDAHPQVRPGLSQRSCAEWLTSGASHQADSKTICYFSDAVSAEQIVSDEDASGRFLIRWLYCA